MSGQRQHSLDAARRIVHFRREAVGRSDGIAILDAPYARASRGGWRGIVSKRLTSPYHSGPTWD
jgi:ATP-dependent DNA ligase